MLILNPYRVLHYIHHMKGKQMITQRCSASKNVWLMLKNMNEVKKNKLQELFRSLISVCEQKEKNDAVTQYSRQNSNFQHVMKMSEAYTSPFCTCPINIQRAVWPQPGLWPQLFTSAGLYLYTSHPTCGTVTFIIHVLWGGCVGVSAFRAGKGHKNEAPQQVFMCTCNKSLFFHLL